MSASMCSFLKISGMEAVDHYVSRIPQIVPAVSGNVVHDAAIVTFLESLQSHSAEISVSDKQHLRYKDPVHIAAQSLRHDVPQPPLRESSNDIETPLHHERSADSSL